MKFSVDDELVAAYERRAAAASAASRELAHRIRAERDSIAEIERDARYRMAQPLAFGRKAPEILLEAMTPTEVTRHRAHQIELAKLQKDDLEADDQASYAMALSTRITQYLGASR